VLFRVLEIVRNVRQLCSAIGMRAFTAFDESESSVRTPGREVYPRPKRESRKADLALHGVEIPVRSAEVARYSAHITHIVDRIALKGAP
jgi:hypothetical protein